MFSGAQGLGVGVTVEVGAVVGVCVTVFVGVGFGSLLHAEIVVVSNRRTIATRCGDFMKSFLDEIRRDENIISPIVAQVMLTHVNGLVYYPAIKTSRPKYRLSSRLVTNPMICSHFLRSFLTSPASANVNPSRAGSAAEKIHA
jgi:hypothetical protein